MSHRNSRPVRGGTPARSLEQSTSGRVELTAPVTADRVAVPVAFEPFLEPAEDE